MEHYVFEGEIQGKFRSIQIYPMAQAPNRYLVHWDGFQVGTVAKTEGTWHTDDSALVDFVPELGTFIDEHEAKIQRDKKG